MQYVILVYETAEQLAQRNGPESKAYWGAYTAYSNALREAGVAVGGNGLLPPATATTVRLSGGKRLVKDGPVSDAKEQLGGYYVIEAASLDDALEWAARCPTLPGASVEVRPVLQMGPPPA